MSAARGLVHRGLAWLFILLAFVGWVLMLAGVASLQQACSGGMVTTLSDLRNVAGQGAALGAPATTLPSFPGTVGYLAPVGCNKFFSYAWWITFFNMTVLILLALGATTLIGTFRGALVAIMAVLLVLLMHTANTFLYFNHIDGLNGTVAARARVLVAGSIISAIAYFLIISIVGWHDEEAATRPPYDTEAAGRKEQKKGGFLSGLFGGGRKEQERQAEYGTGAPGSPRVVQHMPRPPVVPQPMGGGSPAPARSHGGPVSYTTAPTVPVHNAPAVPVSTQAGPIGTRRG